VTGYRQYRDRYRDTVKALAFEGYMKSAKAMP